MRRDRRMKLLHISDLHLGKRLLECSLYDDQRYILSEIVRIAMIERPDAVLIAGDVYDKTVPSAEAVELFDDFLVQLQRAGLTVAVIAGNHDSPERLAFGGRLMAKSGVYVSPVYDGKTEPITLFDAFGPVRLWLLPFIKPAMVRRFFPDEPIETYTDALRAAIAAMPLDGTERNVLLTHQFVTGSLRSESEEIIVGGTDNVDTAVFDAFDYVALGHIHGPQNIGPRLRYCGTPLAYSFSEAKQQKSVTVAELGKKGSLALRTVPLAPLRGLYELRGAYQELMSKAYYDALPYKDAYLHITLTDEDDIPDAVRRLSVVYPNLLKLDYDNRRTRAGLTALRAEDVETKTPLEWFSEFYRKQNGAAPSAEQLSYLSDILDREWEDEA